MCMPVPVTINILTNVAIMMRVLYRSAPLYYYPSIAPLQTNIELRTIQTNQPSSPAPEPSSQGYTYGVVTHILLYITQYRYSSGNSDGLTHRHMNTSVWCITNNVLVYN